jgi:hypothetical protein
MRRLDIYKLYNKISREYGVPIPLYILHQGRLKVKFFNGNYIGGARFFTFDPEISGVDDPFGMILLSCSAPLSSAIHEFFHYLDYLNGYEHNEEYTDQRTLRYIKKNNLKNTHKFNFENTLNQIYNKIMKKYLGYIQLLIACSIIEKGGKRRGMSPFGVGFESNS